jgi:hypothetical protein
MDINVADVGRFSTALGATRCIFSLSRECEKNRCKN